LLHRVPDGRALPGTFASAEELVSLARALREHGGGVFAGSMRFGERDDAERDDDGEHRAGSTRSELDLLTEVARVSRRPVTFGLTQHEGRPDVHLEVLELVHLHADRDVVLRPQTTTRPVQLLFGLDTRTPFDRAPAWDAMRTLDPVRRLQALRDSAVRQRLIAEADEFGSPVDLDRLMVLAQPGEPSLATIAAQRGVSPAGAYIELLLETDGALICGRPIRNQSYEAIAALLDDPAVMVGLSNAGAYTNHMTQAGQTTHLLAHWVRDLGRFELGAAVRRLSADPADALGLVDRGRLVVGACADLNLIELERLELSPPEYVHDRPGGAGRFVQRSQGYHLTLVNGRPLMEAGQPTGVLPGQMLRAG
jgi:N-acyl-D-aspartate/D-glutamate deacylase